MINYLKLKDLLVGIGMITEAAANTDSQERLLLYDIWKNLKGEENEEVPIKDVKLVVMTIMRIS